MSRRRPLVWRLLPIAVMSTLAHGAVLSPAAAGPVAATASACDPDLAADKQVIALREARKTAQALAAVRAVLQSHPDNFRANYLLADVLISQGSASGAKAGLDQLLATEKMLDRQPIVCVRPMGWYSIYNTIGVQYYRAGQIGTALSYFLKGYDHLNDSLPNTKILVLNNLGLMYFKNFDLNNSLKYYKLARDNHSATAQAHIDIINRILKAA